MPRDAEKRDDVSWQWDDAHWSGSTQPPAHPLDVPETGDDRDGFSRAVRRLLSWASTGR
jgi:hypothetical protein